MRLQHTAGRRQRWWDYATTGHGVRAASMATPRRPVSIPHHCDLLSILDSAGDVQLVLLLLLLLEPG